MIDCDWCSNEEVSWDVKVIKCYLQARVQYDWDEVQNVKLNLKDKSRGMRELKSYVK